MELTGRKLFIFGLMAIFIGSLVKSDTTTGNTDTQRCFKACNSSRDVCVQDSVLKGACQNMPYDNSQIRNNTSKDKNCSCSCYTSTGSKIACPGPSGSSVSVCNCNTSTICSNNSLACPDTCNSNATYCNNSCTADKFGGNSSYGFTYTCAGDTAFIVQANNKTADDCKINITDYSSCFCFINFTCSVTQTGSTGGTSGTGGIANVPGATTFTKSGGMCYRCDINPRPPSG